MAINIFCSKCKSSMKIGCYECKKCGEKLTGSNKAYRVRVKLPSGKWKTKTLPSFNMAKKIELQYKTKGIEESTRIQLESPIIADIWPEYLTWAKNNKRTWRDDEIRYRKHVKTHLQGFILKLPLGEQPEIPCIPLVPTVSKDSSQKAVDLTDFE